MSKPEADHTQQPSFSAPLLMQHPILASAELPNPKEVMVTWRHLPCLGLATKNLTFAALGVSLTYSVYQADSPAGEAELFKVLPFIKHPDHAANGLSSRLVVACTTHTQVETLVQPLQLVWSKRLGRR